MTPWARKITELEAAGVSQKEISAATGLAVSSVSDLKTGRSRQPRGDAALKLADLHRQRVPAVAA